MPRLLVNRFADDTITQFRAAARIRYEDAWCLARSGRGAAAIYLWGYVAEMTLKAGWFRLVGHLDDQTISLQDLHSARKMATHTSGIVWTGGLHDIYGWAQLVAEHRIRLRRNYADPHFASEVISRSQRIYERWRETLRYKKNRAYPSEIGTVARSTEWLLVNSLRL